MNETIKNLCERRSIKAYKSDMIEQSILDEILKAGMYAPTGRNKMSPIILCITNLQLRDKLSKMNADIMNVDFDPFYGAPVVLVVLANKDMPTYLYDGSLVMGNLMNAAHSLGVGSCWIHRAKEEFESAEGKKILKELGIEGNYEGIAHCILGYPKNDILPKAIDRKSNYVTYVK